MDYFIPVYQREAILSSGHQWVGSEHAKTCVIMAFVHEKTVVLAHIDAMCTNAVQDMSDKLPNFTKVYVACPVVSASEYNVWKHIESELLKSNPEIEIEIGHESSLAICPETGEVLRGFRNITEHSSDKSSRQLQIIFTLTKETPLRWFSLQGEKLTCEWKLPASVFTFSYNENV
tara:strand:+ start:27 stop:551 length:525 start_codon:yes stop_codon:yes gene_type:complete